LGVKKKPQRNGERKMNMIDTIQAETVKFLANKHGLTEDQVMSLIVNGNEHLTKQLNQLLKVAVETINKM
jgi:hypothetical protein